MGENLYDHIMPSSYYGDYYISYKDMIDDVVSNTTKEEFQRIFNSYFNPKPDKSTDPFYFESMI